MGSNAPQGVERDLAGGSREHDTGLGAVALDPEAGGAPLVDAGVGALLAVLVAATGASRVLEIGTATGSSGIWLARGLPAGGMLLTIEERPDRAAAAKDNFRQAGLADRASVIVGDARLKVAKVAGPFDLVFQNGGPHLHLAMLDRLVALLGDGAAAVAPTVSDYIARLNAHPRLLTSIVAAGGGVSLSVKRSDAG